MLPVAMTMLMATAPAQTYGVATFTQYLLREFDLSQSELSGAYMLGTLLASLPMIYVGVLMDRYGLRKTLAIVVMFLGLACIGMSRAQGLVTVFVGFLFLRMIGQGALSLLAGNILPMWFHRRLGFASGVVSLGEAIPVAFFPSLSLLLIHNAGWRNAYATLGIVVWIVTLPLLALLFRNRPAEIGQEVDGLPTEFDEQRDREPTLFRDHGLREALRTRSYWIMVVAAALPSMILTGIHFHAVQIYLDQGLGEAEAAAMFTTFAAASFAAVLLGGLLADRLPLNLLLSASMAGVSTGIFLLMGVKDSQTSNLFAAVTGGSMGLYGAVNATLWVRYYGRRNLGKIRGGLMTVGVAASSAGPFVMGASHDIFGGYHEVFWAFLVITVPMAGVGLLATRPARIPMSPAVAMELE